MRRALAPLVLAALLLSVAVPGASASPAAATRTALAPYAVLQLNLCLSGLAGCFPRTAYPAVVEEGVERVLESRPDVVTVNEGCSGDVARLAEETGMDSRFATVLYRGAPLPCVSPGGRGVFGNAVLTRAGITGAEDRAFAAQLGAEERRWLCVTTTDGVRACTSHLSVAGSPEQAATNEAQCRELADVLAASGPRTPTVFGGDVNRRSSCAPRGAWTARDDQATQAPGIQHVYGTRPALVRPNEEVLPMTYTDHDALLVRALLVVPAGS